MTRETLSNLTRLDLVELSLFYDLILDVEAGSLAQLVHLQSFMMQYVSMSPESYEAILQELSQVPLVSLEVDGIEYQDVLEFSTFMTFPNLKSLALIENGITSVSPSAVLPFLEEFFMTYNSLAEFPDFCPNGSAVLPRLQLLTMFDCSLPSIQNRKIVCLISLTSLNIRENRILQLDPNTFANLGSLQTVIATKLTYNWLNVKRHAFNNTNIRKIEVDHIEIDDVDTSFIFAGCSGLEHLVLGGRHPKYLYSVIPLRGSLRTLEISSKDTTELPEVLRELNFISTLVISQNKLARIDGSLLMDMTNLTSLDLSDNVLQLDTENAIPVAVQDRLETVDLTGNPLACTCNILWLKNWIGRNTTQFVNYPDGYVCSNNPYKNQTLEGVPITELSCLMAETTREIVIATVSILLILLVVLAVVYRYRWQLQYVVFMLRYDKQRRQQQGEQERQRNFRYDAFIIYDSANHEWIVRHLMPALEDGANFRLCLHERDFLAGKLIVDNIVDSIYASRKVIAIMSEGFAASEWCQFELSLTHRLVLERGHDLMVVVMLEEVAPAHVTRLMYAILKTTTYIAWPDREDARQAFWERLTEAVRILP